MNYVRTFLATFVLVTLLLSFTPGILAQGQGRRPDNAFKIPDNAQQVSEGVFDLGTVDLEGTKVRGRMFVHNVKAFGHNQNAPPNHGGGGGGNGEEDASCFAFITDRKVRWRTTEPYVLDAENSGMRDAAVALAIATSLETWDAEVGFDIFGDRDVAADVAPGQLWTINDKNEIFFLDLVGEDNTIAFTIVWFTAIGRPTIVEFDMVFNSGGFDFGNADNPGPDIMDLENIGAHEAGHGAGLGHPDATCEEETMFGSAALDETKKRDLHAGDIAGINKVY